MREAIEIQLRSHVPDGGTSLTESRVTIAGGTVRAAVREPSIAARFGTVQVAGYAKATHVFTVRFREDVRTNHSVLWRSRNYRVLGTNDPGKMPGETRRRLEIVTAEEGDD